MNKVYVIHWRGVMYEQRGIKIAYLKEGYVKQVITTEAKHMAKLRFEDIDCHNDWYDLSNEERIELINEVKKEFDVVEYVPKM